MPTSSEWEELCSKCNCTWEWTCVEDTPGYRITSKKAGYADSETVRKARKAFEALPRNLTQDQAAQRLPEAARFLTSARGTVGGMRDIERRTAQTFHDRGLDFVNSKNVKQFTEFLDWIGTDKLEALYYRETGGAPREGRGTSRRFRVSELQQTFEQWRVHQ